MIRLSTKMFFRIEHIPSEQTMQAVVAELLPLVPFARRDKALRYKHLHGQYCCLRAWQMLHSLLIEHHFLPADFPLSDLTYTEDDFGKPSFNFQLSTIEFSLSHTKNALAVAINRQPIGIDIEAVASLQRVEDQHFLDRTLSAAEQALVRTAPDPRMAFTELWTCKEAIYKAIGTGINLDTLPGILQTPHPYQLLTAHEDDQFAYSIAYIE